MGEGRGKPKATAILTTATVSDSTTVRTKTLVGSRSPMLVSGGRVVNITLTTDTLSLRKQQRENRQDFKGRLMAANNRPLSSLVGDGALSECPYVWIVGGGPSLKGFDFNKLRGDVVIAVNRAYEIGIPCSMVTMDTRFLRWAEGGEFGEEALEKWRNFRGPKIFTGLANTPLTEGNEQSFYCVERSPGHKGEVTTDRLRDGNNSGYMALQVAVALGAKNIGLLGFDQKGSGDGLQAHYHSGYPTKQKERVYDKQSRFFHDIAPDLRAWGVTVTNYCEDSALEAFDRVPLSKATSHTLNVSRPTVIGYYTEGTPYEEEIKGMEQTARFFGLETDIQPLPNLRDWAHNCLQKPTFILQMMKKHKGPVLYLDADARVRKYPYLFDTFGGDVGYSEVDWSEIGPSKKSEKEVISSVLYLRNTKDVKSKVGAWEMACKAEIASGGKTFDQVFLGHMIESMKSAKPGSTGGTVKLPLSYNQIFDTMRSVGAPVIEQLQASRRMKAGIDG